MSAKTISSFYEAPISTKDGQFLARYSENGLCQLSFPTQRKQRPSAVLPVKIQRWHQATAAAVNAVLAGKSPRGLPPLDLSAGTDFQQQVWQTLAKIRPGSTMSYSEVAAAIGRPRATRAVGGACGANPIPVLVPCHRVLAANHGLGGFSGGLDWKRTLLSREGVAAGH